MNPLQTASEHKTNLKRLSIGELSNFVRLQGLPSFRTGQLINWLYQKQILDLSEITEFSKDLRQKLSDKCFVSTLLILNKLTSCDGTQKFLFALQDDETIESVLLPTEDRLTLCVSSQAGCAMNCHFCLTGRGGFRRNLFPDEIIDQLLTVQREIFPLRITNIVLMGMGEPLMNIDNVSEALWKITEHVSISPKRITLSTCGIVPGLEALPDIAPAVNIAVSLNATTDDVRSRIMPINKNYPITALLKACRQYPIEKRRRITFEYVLLRGINDSDDDARRLLMLLKGIPAKINLIPFNENKEFDFRCPEEERIYGFQKILIEGNMTALIRKSLGSDILGACGQLRAAVSVSKSAPSSK